MEVELVAGQAAREPSHPGVELGHGPQRLGLPESKVVEEVLELAHRGLARRVVDRGGVKLDVDVAERPPQAPPVGEASRHDASLGRETTSTS